MVVDLLDDDALLDLRARARRTDPGAVIAEERRTAPLAPANDDLLQWQAPPPTSPPDDGTCPICNLRPGRRTCNSCHRRVCTGDSWAMLGLCTTCATAEDVARWHRPAAPESWNWLGDRPT